MTEGLGRAAGTAALVVSVLFGILVYLFYFYDGRQAIDLGSWVGPQTAYDREMMPNPRWATDELCDDDLPCIQVVTSDTLTLYRFARREHAVVARRASATTAT